LKEVNHHNTPHALEETLKTLSIADPELSRSVKQQLTQNLSFISNQNLKLLLEDTFWAMEREVSFGWAIAVGFAQLLGQGSINKIPVYRKLVYEFGKTGPTIGRLMAEHLPPVLIHGNDTLLNQFLLAVNTMNAKGTYTLKTSLQVLTNLLNSEDKAAAEAFLILLYDTFSQALNYNQSLHFSYLIPDAVKKFPTKNRHLFISIFAEVIKADYFLADAFLDGLDKGLDLLSQASLKQFVSIGLKKRFHSRQMAANFLSLNSYLGRDCFHKIQILVPFSQVQQSLNRYLRARTGMSLAVRPVSKLSDSVKDKNEALYACSDGKYLYLPDRIGYFNNKEDNFNLYKVLIRLETGLYEFSTFDFDLERFCSQNKLALNNTETDLSMLSDLEKFLVSFSVQQLAYDLFNIFEHGRLRVLMARKYPGLIQKVTPLLTAELNRIPAQIGTENGVCLLLALYAKIGAGVFIPCIQKFLTGTENRIVNDLAEKFEIEISKAPTVETSAGLVFFAYPVVTDFFQNQCRIKDLSTNTCYQPLKVPFNRLIRPDLYRKTFQHIDNLADKLKSKLKMFGLNIFKSEIRKRMIQKGGRLSPDDFNELLQLAQTEPTQSQQIPVFRDFSDTDLKKIIGQYADDSDIETDGSVFWYREWNCHLNDYINDHVRVTDRYIPEQDGRFYEMTLQNYPGLVSRIKYAFELLKPQGLKILRPWSEGDDFDYRAMLDFAIDRKAGWLPSDKLYIKRLKQVRDVAVLLLVDLSRSTRNDVPGSTQSVLDVEKEAIVLFCEALEVLGDDLAIAGFSGTGRLGVDYFRIRDFGEPIKAPVKNRINAMAPQRSTRMGAAIRHAASQLENVPAIVRLMILLGDGFPNDLDYKQEYAIRDTRKAVSETLAKKIAFRAITVNITGDPRLDDLYGAVHHSIISDVRELPDKLLRVYSALTRY
jgi:hypothetical protein